MGGEPGKTKTQDHTRTRREGHSSLRRKCARLWTRPNGACESFNGRLRDECLNEEHFIDVADARRKIETWRLDYNGVRPHTSLDGLTPTEFANRTARAGGMPPEAGKTKTEDQTRDVSESLD
jgi:transposase InsO family protein